MMIEVCAKVRGTRIVPAAALVLILLVAVECGGPTAVWAACVCPGDCNLDCRTDPQEIDRTLAAIFDPAESARCPAADADGSGTVTAADLVLALISAIDPSPDCSGIPTVTATSTAQVSPTPTVTATVASEPVSEWIPLAPLAAGPRQELGVAAVGETIYTIGGFGGASRVEAYDVAADEWRQVADLPQPRNHVGAAALDGLVYSVGGFAGTGFVPVRDVYRYDPATDDWEEVAPLPTARGALAVAVLNGKVHAIGGSGLGGSVTRHDRYDPVNDMWTELAPLPSTPARPGARNHLAAATIDGRIYVVGGRGGPDLPYLDRYDPASNMWEVLESMPTARSGLAAAVVDDRLVVIGGEVNPAHPLGVFPEVEVYDPATRRWTSLEPMAVARHGIGAATVGGLIYVPGGATAAGFGATARNDALRVSW
jgi:N-acetylneuraminic acid mutarotase